MKKLILLSSLFLMGLSTACFGASLIVQDNTGLPGGWYVRVYKGSSLKTKQILNPNTTKVIDLSKRGITENDSYVVQITNKTAFTKNIFFEPRMTLRKGTTDNPISGNQTIIIKKTENQTGWDAKPNHERSQGAIKISGTIYRLYLD